MESQIFEQFLCPFDLFFYTYTVIESISKKFETFPHCRKSVNRLPSENNYKRTL